MEFPGEGNRRARLEPGEDEKLAAEKRLLANAERIYSAAMSAYDSLYESNASAAALMRAACPAGGRAVAL